MSITKTKPMKTKFLLFIILSGTMLLAFGQKASIELTFTADCRGEYVQLDSIYVENLALQCDTMLYWPDTVLVLDYITGIEETNIPVTEQLLLSQNYPNPFTDQTSFEIDIIKPGDLNMSVHGLSGRAVARYNKWMETGHHTFELITPGGGFYILSAQMASETQSIKLLCNTSASSAKTGEIIHKKSEEINPITTERKMDGAFQFNIGNYLRYIGYAITPNDVRGSNIMVDAPEESETYVFAISEGIPCPGLPTIFYELKTYTTVFIDNHCWLQQNLDVGVMVDSTQSQTNNGQIEKYCYENNPAYCDTFGGLYHWNEAMQYTLEPGTQGICPDGWHIPEDWVLRDLEYFLGMPYCISEWSTWRGTYEGWKMKSNTMWADDGNGIDSVGFCMLPSGHYSPMYGGWWGIYEYGYFWTSSQAWPNESWDRAAHSNFDSFGRFSVHKSVAKPIRCIKDQVE